MSGEADMAERIEVLEAIVADLALRLQLLDGAMAVLMPRDSEAYAEHRRRLQAAVDARARREAH